MAFKTEKFLFAKEKKKEPPYRDPDVYGSKPINVSQKTPEATLPNCTKCGKPLEMNDIGSSRKIHLFCP